MMGIISRVSSIYFIFPVQAARRNIPILIDAERKREGLDDLLGLADFAVCSAKFPQASFLTGMFLCLFCGLG